MCMDFTYGKDELVRKGLNEDQIAAITDFSSDLLVLSTAGSGKTRVITEKIAYALGVLRYSPDSILAITFTNKAVDEMRNRVRTLCGERFDLSNLTISTFHSFGLSIIKSYLGKEYEDYEKKDENERFSIIQRLFDVEKKEAKNIGSLIEMAKNNEIFPSDRDDVEAMAAEGNCPDFPRYYSQYEDEFRAHKYFDYEDMIIKADNILEENPKLRAYYNNRYKLILVDEYQDTNKIQDSFLKNVKGPDCQLVVVGDDDQGIYGFRGARVENIRSYHENGDVRTINLGCNYRSTKAILNLATAIIEKSTDRISKRIFTKNEEGEKPLVFNAYDRDDEIRKIIEIIEEDPDMDTAILARKNSILNNFIYPLLHRNLPLDIQDGGLSLLKGDVVKKAFYILLLMDEPLNGEAFVGCLPSEDDLSDDDVEAICLTDYSDYIDAIEKALRGGLLSGRGRVWTSRFLEFYKRAENLKDERVSTAFENAIIHLILGEDGFSKKKKSSDKIREFLQLKNTCFVRSGSTLLHDFLAVFKRSKKDETDNKDEEAVNTIKLLTIHKAKGLEFDRVFVVGVNDDVIPSAKAERLDEEEEERRLFYVALTRAKKRLYVSYCDQDNKGNDCVPSRFLWDVNPALYNGTVEGADDFIPFIPADDIILTNKVAEPAPAEKPHPKDVFKCGDVVITPKGYKAAITHIDDRLHLRILDKGINIYYDIGRAVKELTFYKKEEE